MTFVIVPSCHPSKFLVPSQQQASLISQRHKTKSYLRGRSVDGLSWIMSIHPETEYEFMACQNKLEISGSGSDKSTGNRGQTDLSVQNLGARKPMGQILNLGFQSFFICDLSAGE